MIGIDIHTYFLNNFIRTLKNSSYKVINISRCPIIDLVFLKKVFSRSLPKYFFELLPFKNK